MKVIGLTGGIGSGKSTVASFLEELGAHVIDADVTGHEAIAPGTPAYREIVEFFGKEVLVPDGTINRTKLGKLVFGKREALARLESITHTRITEMVKRRLAQLNNQGVKVAVIEATLLVEGGWRPLVDEVWVTGASQQKILKRLKERSGYSENESLTRIHSQRTNTERLKEADVIIDTNGTLEEVRAKVQELWEKRIGSI